MKKKFYYSILASLTTLIFVTGLVPEIAEFYKIIFIYPYLLSIVALLINILFFSLLVGLFSSYGHKALFVALLLSILLFPLALKNEYIMVTIIAILPSFWFDERRESKIYVPFFFDNIDVGTASKAGILLGIMLIPLIIPLNTSNGGFISFEPLINPPDVYPLIITHRDLIDKMFKNHNVFGSETTGLFLVDNTVLRRARARVYLVNSSVYPVSVTALNISPPNLNSHSIVHLRPPILTLGTFIKTRFGLIYDVDFDDSVLLRNGSDIVAYVPLLSYKRNLYTTVPVPGKVIEIHGDGTIREAKSIPIDKIPLIPRKVADDWISRYKYKDDITKYFREDITTWGPVLGRDPSGHLWWIGVSVNKDDEVTVLLINASSKKRIVYSYVVGHRVPPPNKIKKYLIEKGVDVGGLSVIPVFIGFKNRIPYWIVDMIIDGEIVSISVITPSSVRVIKANKTITINELIDSINSSKAKNTTTKNTNETIKELVKKVNELEKRVEELERELNETRRMCRNR